MRLLCSQYEVYRMYQKYVDQFKWKVELMSVNENGIGGFKEAVYAMITGDGAYSKYEVREWCTPSTACA